MFSVTVQDHTHDVSFLHSSVTSVPKSPRYSRQTLDLKLDLKVGMVTHRSALPYCHTHTGWHCFVAGEGVIKSPRPEYGAYLADKEVWRLKQG